MNIKVRIKNNKEFEKAQLKAFEIGAFWPAGGNHIFEIEDFMLTDDEEFVGIAIDEERNGKILSFHSEIEYFDKDEAKELTLKELLEL